jgi:hypothetical protein
MPKPYHEQGTPLELEPYFRPATDTDGSATTSGWHPVSQESLTTSGISSITTRVQELDDWEHYWYELHHFHSEHDDDEGTNGSMIRYGELPDYDPDEDEEGPPHLLRCCGEDRPRSKAVRLVVDASEKDFVTVHDFLSTVHPWLMSMLDDIRAAMETGRGSPLPADTTLMVVAGCDRLMVVEEQEWSGFKRKQPTPSPEPEMDPRLVALYAQYPEGIPVEFVTNEAGELVARVLPGLISPELAHLLPPTVVQREEPLFEPVQFDLEDPDCFNRPNPLIPYQRQ